VVARANVTTLGYELAPSHAPGYAGAVFEWDNGNTRHIWEEHRVRREEAEEAVLDPMCIDADASSMGDESRDGIVGMTATGRVLQVIFTERDGLVRVLEAKTATSRQQQAYWRQ